MESVPNITPNTALQHVPDRAKGVVAPALAASKFRMARYLPPPDLAPFIEHAWIVEWDLRGQPPFVQRTLPYPSVGRALHTMSDQVLPLSAVFPWDDAAARALVLDGEDDAAMVEAANMLLRTRLPAPDPQVERIAAILRTVETTPGLTQVEALAAGAGLHVRSLQQLFSEYVGVSPKWVIRRFRLHEAADRLAHGEDVDLTGLALDLGYFDQAHFSSDFRRLVGQSPGHYRDKARDEAQRTAAASNSGL